MHSPVSMRDRAVSYSRVAPCHVSTTKPISAANENTSRRRPRTDLASGKCPSSVTDGPRIREMPIVCRGSTRPVVVARRTGSDQTTLHEDQRGDQLPTEAQCPDEGSCPGYAHAEKGLAFDPGVQECEHRSPTHQYQNESSQRKGRARARVRDRCSRISHLVPAPESRSRSSLTHRRTDRASSRCRRAIRSHSGTGRRLAGSSTAGAACATRTRLAARSVALAAVAA